MGGWESRGKESDSDKFSPIPVVFVPALVAGAWCMTLVKAETGKVSVFCFTHAVRTACSPNESHMDASTLVARNHIQRIPAKPSRVPAPRRPRANSQCTALSQGASQCLSLSTVSGCLANSRFVEAELA